MKAVREGKVEMLPELQGNKTQDSSQLTYGYVIDFDE
jgi:hypothetical protein